MSDAVYMAHSPPAYAAPVAVGEPVQAGVALNIRQISSVRDSFYDTHDGLKNGWHLQNMQCGNGNRMSRVAAWHNLVIFPSSGTPFEANHSLFCFFSGLHPWLLLGADLPAFHSVPGYYCHGILRRHYVRIRALLCRVFWPHPLR